jgi:hypothetical protein
VQEKAKLPARARSELSVKEALLLTMYIVSIYAFLLMAMASGASPPVPDKPEDGASGVGPPPLADLARLAEQGRLEGVTVEYWVGGGLPPPFYRSDQFRLLTFENRDIFEFARPYRDPATKREGLVEKFQLAAQPSDVRRLAKLILDTGVFERHFPEEKDPGRADALTTEIIVIIGGREFKRRYFTGSPKPLEPLRAEVERLVQKLVASGKREILYQGKPIALPQEPARGNVSGAQTTPDTVPRSELAEEVGRRIDRRLSTQGRLVLWLRVSETDPARAAAGDVKRVLEKKPGLVFSTQTVAGARPVPSEIPGGHVHMLVYAFEPHPDIVLFVGEMNGRLYVSERDAGKDPLAPAFRTNWILYAR